MMKPKVRIIGAGAVGLLYGAKLQAYGCETEFQSASGFEDLNSKGLKLSSIWGDLDLKVKAFANTHQMTKGDIILVCNKAVEKIDYGTLLGPVVKKDSMICLLQNGLNNDEKIRTSFPDNPYCAGAAFVCSNRIAANEVHHLAYGRIELGWTGTEPDAATKALEKLFLEAGVECRCTAEFRLVRWRKLLWNIPFNTLSVVTGGEDTKVMVESPVLLPLIGTLMSEVRNAAAAEGWMISEAEAQKMIDHTRNMVPYKTSMLLDYEKHRPMEIDAILEQPVKSAQEAGSPMPSVKVLSALVRELERRNLS